MHRDPTHVIAHDLALASVEASADFKSQRTHPLRHRARAADGPRRTVEGGEKAVAGRVDLTSTKSSEFAANHGVVTIEKIAPTAVAERGRFFRRADDVREEHRCENAVRLRASTHPGQELLDLSQDRVHVTEPWKVIFPGQFDEPPPGIRSAIYRLAPIGIVKSRTLWSNNVGTRIAGRTCRISISSFIATSAITAAGLRPF